jgi:phosphinothricin acetyltransferase
MNTPLIRDSRDADLTAIQAIYAHHVLHGTGTFEITPPDLAEMTRRRADVVKNGFPYLVAHEGDRVLGYAYVNWFRLRPAYRFTVEDSIYIDESARGRGVGRLLLTALIERCEAKGLRLMIAVIGDSANAPSIGLHKAIGFQPAGMLPATGWKHGRWVDTVLMTRPLGLGATAPPEE